MEEILLFSRGFVPKFWLPKLTQTTIPILDLVKQNRWHKIETLPGAQVECRGDLYALE
jgi:hypothetical protein